MRCTVARVAWNVVTSPLREGRLGHVQVHVTNASHLHTK